LLALSFLISLVGKLGASTLIDFKTLTFAQVKTLSTLLLAGMFLSTAALATSS
jgi:hypothetical protein